MDIPQQERRSWLERPWKGLIYLSAGLVLFGWLVTTPVGLFGKADAVGYAVCHRIDLRSFHLGARQLPLCARCTGMYLGTMLGLVFLASVDRKRSGAPPLRVITLLGILVAAFGIDGLNSFLDLIPGDISFYKPENSIRLVTGTGMGIAIAAALFLAFNQTVWKVIDTRRVLNGLPSLGGLLVASLLLDLAVLTENSILLYPLALASAVGVVVVLTLAYTLLWMIALRIENRRQSYSELLLPLIGGFTFALIQIGLLDLGRFLLTGTWEGFHLG